MSASKPASGLPAWLVTSLHVRLLACLLNCSLVSDNTIKSLACLNTCLPICLLACFLPCLRVRLYRSQYSLHAHYTIGCILPQSPFCILVMNTQIIENHHLRGLCFGFLRLELSVCQPVSPQPACPKPTWFARLPSLLANICQFSLLAFNYHTCL